MPETYQDLSALVEATEGYTGRRYLALYLALRNGAPPETLAVLAALADQAAEAVRAVIPWTAIHAAIAKATDRNA